MTQCEPFASSASSQSIASWRRASTSSGSRSRTASAASSRSSPRDTPGWAAIVYTDRFESHPWDETIQEYTTEEIDQRFALLDQYERRCVIRFLQETETDHVSISDLVSHLRKQNPTPDDRDKLAIALHHYHLPKLAVVGALEFDSGSGAVRYNGDELERTSNRPRRRTFQTPKKRAHAPVSL